MQGADLFGLDLICERGTGVWHVIDVNYFPGYYDAPNLSAMFIALIDRKLQEMKPVQ